MIDNLHLLGHPTLQHKLGILRDKYTSSAEVRRLVSEISTLLAYEASQDLSLKKMTVATPIGPSVISQIDQPPLVVSILRAGNSMIDGVLVILSSAKVGHIGIYRDRFSQNTVEYYFRLPDRDHVTGKNILLLDPLIATGDTILASIGRLQQFDVGNIQVLSLLISEKALARLKHFYPAVQVYTLGVEKQVNEEGFLVPGIGDISSRLYGWASEVHVEY